MKKTLRSVAILFVLVPLFTIIFAFIMRFLIFASEPIGNELLRLSIDLAQEIPFADVLLKMVKMNLVGVEEYLNITFGVFVSEFLSAILFGIIIFIIESLIQHFKKLKTLSLLWKLLGIVLGSYILKGGNNFSQAVNILYQIGFIFILILIIWLLTKLVFGRIISFTKKLSYISCKIIINAIVSVILCCAMTVLAFVIVTEPTIIMAKLGSVITVWIITAVAMFTSLFIDDAIDKTLK